MDLEGKPTKKPFKPFLTQPRRRFKGNFEKDAMGKVDILEASTATEEIDISGASTATEEIDMEDLVTEDHSSPEDPLVNLTLTEEWLYLIMSNQSKEGCCKRIRTHVKLPKLQFRQFRHNYTDS